jgi:hypothetical protein
MEMLFASESRYLWGALLMAALFFPVRQLIWVLTVRRAVRKGGEAKVGAAEQARLKKRAGMTSALLCFLFALAYVNVLFGE